jgi:hypothetical protein
MRVSQSQLEYGRQRDLQAHFFRHQQPAGRLFDRTEFGSKYLYNRNKISELKRNGIIKEQFTEVF